jgi:hypothetical protein
LLSLLSGESADRVTSGHFLNHVSFHRGRIGDYQHISVLARYGNVRFVGCIGVLLRVSLPLCQQLTDFYLYNQRHESNRASTVDIRNMRKQLNNKKAIATGVFCQFVLLPFLGWAIVELFRLPPPVGITLLVVVSSPGGSYSNWWCRYAFHYDVICDSFVFMLVYMLTTIAFVLSFSTVL